MNVLITGASGFVGKNLIPYLRARNFTKISTINRAALNSINNADINDADVIIHLAGKAHDLKNISNGDEYYAVNYALTKKVYDTFLQSSASKFIFVSSVKAAADHIAGVLTEDSPAQPETHYGKSKLMAEKYIETQKLPENKAYYILRPCMIHGAGNKGNLNLLYQFVIRGIPYPLAAFNNKRSLLSVENFCFIAKEIIEQRDVPSGVYNVADDLPLSTVKIVEIIADAIDSKPKLWAIPVGLMRFVAKVGGLVGLPLNIERLNKLTEDFCVSNNKIKAALKKKLPVESEDGLRKTIVSFKIKQIIKI